MRRVNLSSEEQERLRDKRRAYLAHSAFYQAHEDEIRAKYGFNHIVIFDGNQTVGFEHSDEVLDFLDTLSEPSRSCAFVNWVYADSGIWPLRVSRTA